MSAASIKKRAADRRAAGKGPKNTSYTTADGRGVSIKNGVKTYSDKPVNVKGRSGQSISGRDYSINKGGTGYAPVITPESVAKTDVADIPTYTAPTGDFGSILTQGNTELADPTIGLTQQSGQFVYDPNKSAAVNAAEEANMGSQNTLAAIAQYLKPKENEFSDVYADIEKKSGLLKYQKDVNTYSSQLNNITSSRDAEMLKLEGQGRGQTSGFIGGEQARINREAAIQALPVQAQLAAAQGNLEMAQSRVNTLFQIKSQDIAAQNAYKTNLANSVMQYANQAQQNILNAKLGDIQKQEAREQQALQDAKQIALQAIEYGQSSLAARVMGLDPKSATYADDVRSAMAQLRKPVEAVAQKAPTLQNFGTSDNPIWKEYDYATGQWVDIAGVGGVSSQKQAASIIATQRQIDTIDSILSSKAVDSVVGTSIFSRGAGTIGGLVARALLGGGVAALQGSKDSITGDRQELIANVNNLIANASMDKLIQSKQSGATYGALSDTEWKKIDAAATKLGSYQMTTGTGDQKKTIGFNASEDSFLKEVDTLKYYAVLDLAVRGADISQVGAVQTEDGWYFRNYDGSVTKLELQY